MHACYLDSSIRGSYLSCLCYLEGKIFLSVSGHKKHIGHAADIHTVALSLLRGTGRIDQTIEQRVAEKPSAAEKAVTERTLEFLTGLFKAIVIDCFHSNDSSLCILPKKYAHTGILFL